MKRFAQLFREIDGSTKTTVKVAALADYFRDAPETDRLWTVALFSGRRPRRAITTTRLREWAAERAGLPLWLLEESYAIVGDLAETIALLLPTGESVDDSGLTFWINALRDISNVSEEDRKDFIHRAWDQLGTTERFLFNKLITGGFRIGVSQKLMTRALAQATGRDEAEMAHRLMGNWTPETTSWHELIEAENSAADASRPYPFYLAYGLDTEPEALGLPEDWRAEWKWDGIRGQLVLRDGSHFLWSRGEELITDTFPEFARAVDFVPDGTVLDGEIMVWTAEGPQSFNALQKRIGRKTVSKKLLTDAIADNFSAVADIFSSEDGYAVRLDTLLNRYTEAGGIIDIRTEGYNTQIDRITSQREALDRRIAAIEARYTAQFNALDTLLGELSTTGDFLTEQLANLPGMVKSDK